MSEERIEQLQIEYRQIGASVCALGAEGLARRPEVARMFQERQDEIVRQLARFGARPVVLREAE